MRERGRITLGFVWGLVVILGSCVSAIEHNLPDNVELVDPKDLGLDSQIDLDKLLGNVKALPIDTNALSSALGKPGLKTQVLTVGFDGSEGLNLDDFELPHLKNDEHGPLAQEAFKSFKNFFKNSSGVSQVDDSGATVPPGLAGLIAGAQGHSAPDPVGTPVVRTVNGKKRTMMRRRKVVRANGTTPTTPKPVSTTPYQGPKVIELDSSQIEKLIASGKIGPPKSITPGGPQVIELGQSDLDALLSSENGDEIKQILEGGDAINNFDLSQLSTAAQGPPPSSPVPVASSQPVPEVDPTTITTTNRVVESNPPISIAQLVNQVSSPIPTETSSTTTAAVAPSTNSVATEESPSTILTTSEEVPSPTTPSLPPTAPPTTTTTGLPIIYQYNSANDQPRHAAIPTRGLQGSIPLQFYSSHADGRQVAKQIKTPTFEFISAPPVSFSSSVLPSNAQQQQQQQQAQPVYIQPQIQTQQFPNAFIRQSQPQFVIASPQNSAPQQIQKQPESLNIVSSQQSNNEQIKPSVSDNVVPNTNSNNYIQSLHKVNLPVNSVKLVTPSPQAVHSVLNQVPASFQPAIVPNHIVSSPVLDPLRLSPQQGNFLRVQQSQPSQPLEPFRNTQLFNSPQSQTRPSSSSSSSFRFPTTSNILASPPSRFRTSESSNPFFQSQPGGLNNLVLNSFVAGDGLNYRPRSREDYNAPGI